MSPRPEGPPPATGAWREGDHPGERRFADLGPITLELGGALPQVRVAYETWGTLSPAGDNAVLVLHALTGDAHAAGDAGPGQPTPGWWDALIGPGRALDTDRLFVLSANVLGGCQGTTGPSSPAPDGRPWGSRWPRVTIRDQVEVERRLADHLGIASFAAIVGGSMGGMRGLEWVVQHPDRVRSALLLATCAAATADQIGTQTAQIHAITSDPRWHGGDYHGARDGEGPHVGMGIARRFAHLTYRTEDELDLRFGRDPQDGEDPLTPSTPGRHAPAGRFAVQSYLDHHADKLARRFDAGTYVCLSDAMNTHDVGRGRGGVAAALGTVRVPVVVGGIDSDRLYPIRLQQEMADAIPTVDGLQVIDTPYGHDGFLIESEAVSRLVERTLRHARVPVED
ncbi:MAG: homoserine O-acetyltransferase [Candidatus Nanopelagicales bacterium]